MHRCNGVFNPVCRSSFSSFHARSLGTHLSSECPDCCCFRENKRRKSTRNIERIRLNPPTWYSSKHNFLRIHLRRFYLERPASQTQRARKHVKVKLFIDLAVQTIWNSIQARRSTASSGTATTDTRDLNRTGSMRQSSS